MSSTRNNSSIGDNSRANHQLRQGLEATAQSIMTDDKILLAAQQFVERYGLDAPQQAVLRADELSLEGAALEAAMWMRISKAAKALLDTPPRRQSQKH